VGSMFVRSFVRSFVCLFVYLFVCSFIQMSEHLVTRLCINPKTAIIYPYMTGQWDITVLSLCLIAGKFLTWKSYCLQYFFHILHTFNTEDMQMNYLSVTHITNLRSDFNFSWLLLM
jgi:H+/Cl- antiporter ClcA